MEPRRYRKLTLLHSNDIHGDFLAEQAKDRLVGGFSMLSGYVSKVRREEPNTLYCVAGDMFWGSVIDSEYQGISTIEFMNLLAPDVVCVGNHEVDYGVAHLLFLEKCASFPLINANMYIRGSHARLFEPFLIREVDGMKVLFIGILTEEVTAHTKNDGLTGPMVIIEEAAREVERICNAYRSVDIDLTVLMTHIGIEADKRLAAALDPSLGVDVIIGGHSHTFMKEPLLVNGIQIVQAGMGTDQIGRFDLVVDTEENRVAAWGWQCVPIEEGSCPRDERLEELITSYKEATDAKYLRVITRLARELTHPERNRQTEIGSLLTDALKNSFGVDIMLVASGSIRRPSLGPIVLLQDLRECFPYDEAVHMLTLTGAQLRKMFSWMLREEVWQGVHSEFYQLSEGLKVVWRRETQTLEQFELNGRPVEEDRFYTLGLQNYVYQSFDDLFHFPRAEAEANAAPRLLCTSDVDVLEEYLSASHLLDSHGTDRLTVL